MSHCHSLSVLSQCPSLWASVRVSLSTARGRNGSTLPLPLSLLRAWGRSRLWIVSPVDGDAVVVVSAGREQEPAVAGEGERGDGALVEPLREPDVHRLHENALKRTATGRVQEVTPARCWLGKCTRISCFSDKSAACQMMISGSLPPSPAFEAIPPVATSCLLGSMARQRMSSLWPWKWRGRGRPLAVRSGVRQQSSSEIV